MPRDPFIREKFTRLRISARKLAAEYFERFPKGRYLTEIESWRHLQSDNGLVAYLASGESGPPRRKSGLDPEQPQPSPMQGIRVVSMTRARCGYPWGAR